MSNNLILEKYIENVVIENILSISVILNLINIYGMVIKSDDLYNDMRTICMKNKYNQVTIKSKIYSYSGEKFTEYNEIIIEKFDIFYKTPNDKIEYKYLAFNKK